MSNDASLGLADGKFSGAFYPKHVTLGGAAAWRRGGGAMHRNVMSLGDNEHSRRSVPLRPREHSCCRAPFPFPPPLPCE